MADKANSETTDLVINDKNQVELRNFNQVWRLSKLLVKSGLFGTSNKAEVATKIATGLEIGISPIRAVRHIDTINGSPSVSAQLSAAMLRMHESYDYHVDEVTMDRAEVTITYNGDEKGSASFTWEEAQQAGLANKDNWQSYRRDMLFSRAIKRAKKWHAPNVGMGREYMPDELGADEKSTVSVPSEVVDAADEEDESEPKSNATDVDYKVEDENASESKSESEDTTSDSDFSMDVSDASEARKEVEGSSKTNTSKSPEKSPTSDGSDIPSKGKYEPYAIPGGIEGVEGGKISQIEYELKQKKSHKVKLQSAIDRYWSYWRNCSEGEFKSRLKEILEIYEDKLPREDEEVDGEATISDLMGPTQTIIKEMDDNLSKLSGDDLSEQISNYRQEISQYSEPAKSVAVSTIENHEDRLDDSEVSDEQKEDVNRQKKQRAAEWQSNLSTSQTLLGQKMNETQEWKPLRDLLSKLDKKGRSYISETEDMFGECGLTENMKTQWAMASSPYYIIVDLRKAIMDGDMNIDKFNDTLDEFTSQIKTWDDTDKASKAHEIVHNEVMRMDENLDYFNIQKS